MTFEEYRQAVVFAARFEWATQRFVLVATGEEFELTELEQRAALDGINALGSGTRAARPVANPARVREYWADALPPGTRQADYPPEWCGALCLFCIHRAELGLDVFWRRGFAAAHLRQREPHELPEPGDVAYFRRFQHHAIVEDVNAAALTFDSIDGNQAPGIVRHQGRPLASVAAFYSLGPLIEAKEAKHGPEV